MAAIDFMRLVARAQKNPFQSDLWTKTSLFRETSGESFRFAYSAPGIITYGASAAAPATLGTSTGTSASATTSVTQCVIQMSLPLGLDKDENAILEANFDTVASYIDVQLNSAVVAAMKAGGTAITPTTVAATTAALRNGISGSIFQNDVEFILDGGAQLALENKPTFFPLRQYVGKNRHYVPTAQGIIAASPKGTGLLVGPMDFTTSRVALLEQAVISARVGFQFAAITNPASAAYCLTANLPTA